MIKIIAVLSVAIGLSACGGGSSSKAQTSSGAVDNTTTAASTVTDAENTTAPENGAETTDSGGKPSATGGGSGSSGAGVNQLGVVNFDVDGSAELSAVFYTIPSQLPSNEVLKQFTPTLDTCEVSRIDLVGGGTNPDIPDTLDNIDGLMVTTISAGEVLTISSPAGSYAELKRGQQFGFTRYTTEDGVNLSLPVPTNLSINVPGDQFAAFTNIEFPPLVPLEVSSPANLNAITASTAFSWAGNATPGSFIEISATAIAADFKSIVSVDCNAADDGSFAFPSDTQAELSEFVGNGTLSRYALKTVQQTNSVLVISVLFEKAN